MIDKIMHGFLNRVYDFVLLKTVSTDIIQVLVDTFIITRCCV